MDDQPTLADLEEVVDRREVERSCPELLRDLRDGDQLRSWSRDGGALAVHSGYALVRGGRIVASCLHLAS